jgi:beta-glucosidase
VQGFDFGHQEWHDGIVSGVLFGRIKMSALDAAVGRVLRVKARLGLLGGGRSALVEDVSRYHTLISSDAHVAVAHEAARKAMVL